MGQNREAILMPSLSYFEHLDDKLQSSEIKYLQNLNWDTNILQGNLQGLEAL
jgi:hypothetical protein